MFPVRSRLTLCRALVVLLAAVTTPVAGAGSYAGRSVQAVLGELQNADLTLIYNDALVPPGLRVLREPAAKAGIPLLNEILAPHGLIARSMGPQTWAIVALPASMPAGNPDAAPRPRIALEEVVVTASQYSLTRTAPEARTVLSQQELRSLPKLADEPLRAVHRLPGAASNGLSGLAHIRGGEENETQIVLDGMPLQNPFHLKGFFSPVSLLDAEVVGELDVYGGGFPVDYGGRMGAVVDARSVDPGAERSYALGISLFHLNGMASATFAGDRGRWLASARRSNLAEVLSVGDSDLGEPKYVDTFLKAEYDLSSNTTLAAHALLAQDRIELNDSDKTILARTLDRNAYVWVTAGHGWSEETSGKVLLGWTRSDSERSGSMDIPDEKAGTLKDQRDSDSLLLRLEIEHGDDSLQWRAGLDAAWRTAKYRYTSNLETVAGFPFPDSPAESIARDAQPQPDGFETGAFVAARWRVSNALTGEVGLRWDNQTYDPAGSSNQLSPRVNLLYDVSPDTQLRASWGRFYQPQGIDELQVEDGIDTFFPAQRSDHFILSLEHAFTDSVSVRLEAYTKDYDGLRPRFENLFDPLELLPELETDRVAVAASASTVNGIELLVHDRSAQPWGWWLSYAFSKAEETVDGADIPRSWDQRHAVNGGISWTKGPWELALAGAWHTGWPTTPVSLSPGSTTGVVIGERNSARFEPFRSLDLRAGYTFELGDTELLTFVELINTLGQKNPCCVEYTVLDPGTAGAALHQDFDYWPRFVPNLGVLWKF